MSSGKQLERIKKCVAAEQRQIVGIGKFIHANPELGFKEHLAADRITAYLAGLGFKIEMPYGGLQTGFRASIRGAGRGPTVGICAEYDALAGLGHGCGHNLITVAALAAAAGVVGCCDSWAGGFDVIGTPAEELFVGKSPMVDAGAFGHLDACFMTHPSTESRLTTKSNALRSFTARFHGKAAHAAASPQDGINALDAAIMFFNSIHAMRQHLREDARVHGIITEGGTALNVIPELAVVEMGVRSQDEAYLKDLEKRVADTCRAAARTVGAKVTIRWDKHGYRSFRLNPALDDILGESYSDAGIRLSSDWARVGRGSLDMGNVSQVVPAAHPFFNIVPPNAKCTALHTREFMACANEPHAYRQAVKAGSGMALTALRLLSDRGAMRAVKKNFRR